MDFDTFIALALALFGFIGWQWEKHKRTEFWRTECMKCLEAHHRAQLKMEAWKQEVKASLYADGKIDEANRIQ